MLFFSPVQWVLRRREMGTYKPLPTILTSSLDNVYLDYGEGFLDLLKPYGKIAFLWDHLYFYSLLWELPLCLWTLWVLSVWVTVILLALDCIMVRQTVQKHHFSRYAKVVCQEWTRFCSHLEWNTAGVSLLKQTMLNKCHIGLNKRGKYDPVIKMHKRILHACLHRILCLLSDITSINCLPLFSLSRKSSFRKCHSRFFCWRLNGCKEYQDWIRRKRVPWISELSGKNLTAAEPWKEETAGGSQLFLSVRQLDCIYTNPMTTKKQHSRLDRKSVV